MPFTDCAWHYDLGFDWNASSSAIKAKALLDVKEKAVLSQLALDFHGLHIDAVNEQNSAKNWYPFNNHPLNWISLIWKKRVPLAKRK